MLPFASLGPLNQPSHKLAIRGGDVLFSRTIREWRAASLGLNGKKRPEPSSGTLYAYSRHVVPVPPDWGNDVLVSGYWFLDEDGWRPPSDLLAFLEGGEPPIYIGFGSMPGLDPDRTSRLIFEALERAGKRGLLATGGGALRAENPPPNVHVIASAPHAQLFPHVSAAVHHGGAGTTAAALRAGIPAVICPFFGDQPFWARRVQELGAGPPALNRKQLTAETLAAAIKLMDGPKIRGRAAEIGAHIRNEDGISSAVAFIEQAGHRARSEASGAKQ
jgi:UDP:flavonoid glycosyltransferase YjiC (YdhE family)